MVSTSASFLRSLRAAAVAALVTALAGAQVRVTERAMFSGVESIASGGFHDPVRNLLILSSLGELKEWDGPGTARSLPYPRTVQAALCEYSADRGAGLVWNNVIGTWKYRAGTWTQLLAPGAPVSATAFINRQAMVWDPQRQRALLLVQTGLTAAYEFTGAQWLPIPTPPGFNLFGGMVYDGTRNMPLVLTDAGAFHWNGNSWYPTGAPAGSFVHDRALAWDEQRGRLVAFGGYLPFGLTIADLHEWDGTQWVTIVPPSGPSARSGGTLIYDRLRRQCVLFGGDTAPFQTSDEVWSWNGATWTDLSASMTRPPELNDAMLAEIEANGSLLFGGRDANNVPSMATWLWDGDVWTDLSANGTAGARSAGAMTRQAPDSVLLFGGMDANGNVFGDTWRFSAAGGWQQRFPVQSPSARLNHAMATDVAGGNTVWLFGGSTGANFHGDLWYFSSTFGIDLWTQVGAPGPSPRDIHAMTCDERRRKLVLFGGRDASLPALADTWEFDLVSQTWTLASPLVQPPARINHALVFDPLRSRSVLLGGYSPYTGAYLDDVWEWDGVQWQQVQPATRSIRGSENPAACYDRYTSRIVTFGGQLAAGGPMSDRTFELQGHVDRAALGQVHPIDLRVTGWPVVGTLQAPLRVEMPSTAGVSALFVGIDPAPQPYAIVSLPPFCSTQALYVPGLASFLAIGNPGVVTLNLPPIAAGARLTFQGASLEVGNCVNVTDAWLVRVRSF